MTDPATDPAADPGADAAADPESETQAMQQALGRLLASVARLAVARGLPFAAVDEMLKQAFVDAASAAHPALAPHRRVSRIATGINRRELTRLTQPARAGAPAAGRARSLASEVFAHWRAQPLYRGEDGEPRRLPRQGPTPSVETLAHQISRDVHPRSLLEELTRLGLAELDAASDTVGLVRDAYVPSGDRVRMLGFLGDNVGDHLQAAVENVLVSDRTHFEQAVFADGLSHESIAALRPLIAAQWQAFLAAMVPQLEARIAADASRGPAAAGRVRVGLYSSQESTRGRRAAGRCRRRSMSTSWPQRGIPGFLVAMFTAAWLVAGCGGGVGTAGTGFFASGPITGFGSVVANDVVFDDSGASVQDGDGSPRVRGCGRACSPARCGLHWMPEVRSSGAAMNESPAQRALAASSAALAVAVACLLAFMPSLFERVLAMPLGTVVVGAVLVAAVTLHWAFLGIGVHRLGRSLPGWLTLSVLLFPIGGVAALVLLGWLSDEDRASGQPLPVR